VITDVQPVVLVVVPRLFTVAPLQASLAVGGVKLGVAVHSMVALPPACPIVGGWVSTTVMTCVRVALWLPQASVASHVLVRTFVQPVVLVVVPRLFTVAPLQSSDAVGGVKLGVAVHSIVAFPPAAPIVGAWVSTTVIDCVLVAE